MNFKAIITGDIVHSRKVGDMHLLLYGLKDIILEISRVLNTPIKFEIYRGDSFQMLVDKPEQSVLITILLRAGLKSKTSFTNLTQPNQSLEKLWDARLSIGIGSIDFQAEKLAESNGEAFEFSGGQLDTMNKTQEKIKFKSRWENINEQFDIILQLADTIISRWTINSSSAAYRYLLYSETQNQIAEHYNISQPAVHKRLNTANIDVIENTLNYIDQTLKKQIYGI